MQNLNEFPEREPIRLQDGEAARATYLELERIGDGMVLP